MKRGIRFNIPNTYGRFLTDMLSPIDIAAYSWFVGGEESYRVKNGNLDQPLFPEATEMDGETFSDLIHQDEHYLIFVNVKAFSKEPVKDIETYEAFRDSNCELTLLIVDSTFVDIYCKDETLLESFYQHALACGYEDVAYLTDANDTRTSLTVW
ncbi:DUF2691 family protein [Exiguobacterium sp. s146]|uniref:DUF2691 family protein n=1 Tax=Exiguobacterium sp. s146 TaxID=2751223 RepID=UPI001BE59462